MQTRSRYLYLVTRRLHVVAIAIGLGLVSFGAQGEDDGGFVAGVEDLPLMPGLHEIQEAGTMFDSAGGRIVEAYAVGQVDESAVITFYSDSLPQLGWTIVDKTVFRRSGETLRLEFAREDAQLTVHFSLSPE